MQHKLGTLLFEGEAKKYWMIAGLILAIAGQSIIREIQPLTSFRSISEFSISLNKTLYLTSNNPVNIIIGLSLIILAILIYSRAFALHSTSREAEQSRLGNWNWSSCRKFLPYITANAGVYALIMFQIANHRYSNPLFIIWLTCISIFTFVFWKQWREDEVNSSLSITYADGIWILVLFGFAIAEGSYLLNTLPAGWIADESEFWIMARSIAIGEKNPPFFDFGVFTFPVASSILQARIMQWAGINMWGWRFSSVLPAALTVIPLYLLTSNLFDRRTAIITNVLMIVNPYFLTFARLGYNNSQSLFPVTLAIYFLVVGIKKNNRFYLWLAGLTAGLCFYTYLAALLGLAVPIIAIMIFSRTSSMKFQNDISPLLIVLAGAFVVFLPKILYGMSGDASSSLYRKFVETIPVNTFYGQTVFEGDRIAQATPIHISLGGDEFELFYSPSLYAIILLRGVILTAGVLFDPILHFDHHLTFGLAGPGSSIFFILGLGITLANSRKKSYLIPSIWFFSGFIFLGVITSFPPRPTHMVAIIPALSLISAIGLISFIDNMISVNPARYKIELSLRKIATSSTLLFIVTISFIQFFFLTLYAYFPPNADDYVSWLGRQIPQQATIILVDYQAAIRSPYNEVSLKLTPHYILLLTRSKLESNPGQINEWKNFVAYVSSRDGRKFAEWVANEIPGSKVQTAYIPGKRLRGYVVTDMQLNASMDISPRQGIHDLWNSPARNILLFCGIVIIALLPAALKQKESVQ